MLMRLKSLLWISGLALALGCSSSPNDAPLGGVDGKADSATECSYDRTFAEADVSSELEQAVVSAAEMSVDDIESLSEVQTAQLIAAAVQLESVEPGSVIDNVFAAADEGAIEVLSLTVESDGETSDYDWVRYFAGDNEVGVVFKDDSLDIVAEISDGDILGCVNPQLELEDSAASILAGKGMAGLSFVVELLEVQMQGDIDSGVSFASALGTAVDGVLADGALLLAFTEGEIARAEDCPELPFAEGLACTIGKVGSLRLVALGEELDAPVNVEEDWVFELTLADQIYYAVVSRSDDSAAARIVK